MSDPNKAYVYALITVLFWSTVATAFKVALLYLDIFQLVFYASLSSSLVLVTPIVAQGKLAGLLATFKAHWKITLVASCLNPLCYYIVLFAAYDRLPAQVAQPINYTWAITHQRGIDSYAKPFWRVQSFSSSPIRATPSQPAEVNGGVDVGAATPAHIRLPVGTAAVAVIMALLRASPNVHALDRVQPANDPTMLCRRGS